jgi:hypothetical protein
MINDKSLSEHQRFLLRETAERTGQHAAAALLLPKPENHTCINETFLLGMIESGDMKDVKDEGDIALTAAPLSPGALHRLISAATKIKDEETEGMLLYLYAKAKLQLCHDAENLKRILEKVPMKYRHSELWTIAGDAQDMEMATHALLAVDWPRPHVGHSEVSVLLLFINSGAKDPKKHRKNEGVTEADFVKAADQLSQQELELVISAARRVHDDEMVGWLRCLENKFPASEIKHGIEEQCDLRRAKKRKSALDE